MRCELNSELSCAELLQHRSPAENVSADRQKARYFLFDLTPKVTVASTVHHWKKSRETTVAFEINAALCVP